MKKSKMEEKYGDKKLRNLAKECDSLEYYDQYVNLRHKQHTSEIKICVYLVLMILAGIGTFFFIGFISFVWLFMIMLLYENHEMSINSLWRAHWLTTIARNAENKNWKDLAEAIVKKAKEVKERKKNESDNK